MHRIVLLLAASFLFLASAGAQQKEKPKWPPSPHVAATEALRPAEEAKKIKLPPGFELQLVAADPDIRKPININFDAAGRLWITETIEYPFAAKPGEGRDAVKILEDFGPDGRAHKITTFADKLNIPIGVFPTANGALVYSIPSIFHMADTKGSGKADLREVFYSGFGHNDTHGMTGEFMQGFDGWVYACHGYANTSKVKSRGDTAITMTSGNTYRIKADGSRIEQWTWGQVNPFGLAFDPYGNLFSGDCHSQPLTMLLRHGWYVSFARPHDGLGFAPHMNTFGSEHSTALCGVAYYAADQYPDEYRGRLFLGDVVTNRINSYHLDWSGASPKAVLKNFLTSDDPWFRPVDVKLGPDGCLYFADFYNRIIGHYEVPLNHPGRDHDKGRIWRIVYRGKDGKSGPQPATNLAKADVKTLVQNLGHANLTVRLQATHQLVERGGKEAVAALRPIVKNVGAAGDGAKKVHALWALERLGKLDDDTLARASSALEKEVRVHAQRILTEKPTWSPKYAAIAKLGLEDSEPVVRRVAVEALAAHPAAAQIQPIVLLQRKVAANDTHLEYAARLALRDQLRLPEAWESIKRVDWRDDDRARIADVCLSIRTEPAAEYLKAYLTAPGKGADSPDQATRFTHHIVRYGSAGSVGWAIDHVKGTFPKQVGAQGSVVKIALQAAQERGMKLTDAERSAAQDIVARLLQTTPAKDLQLGVELAGNLKMTKTQPQLLALVVKPKLPDALRQASIAALINIDAAAAVKPLTAMLVDEKEAIEVRIQVAGALAGTNHPDAHQALLASLQGAPARLQSTIALGMAGSPQGGDRLLQAIEAGKASPRLLQDRAIELRLAGAKIANVKDRLQKLTKGLPSADQKTQQMLLQRRDAFVSFKSDAAVGQKVFQKSCANCHQIANQGAKVGPNLDGIGVRGLERLLEDVLDPNRNVDQAFRTTVIATKGGQTFTGLFLREEGNVLILADKDGKDLRIEKGQIDERSVSPLSPMPGNFLEALSEPDLHHLMAYLLSQRAKQ